MKICRPLLNNEIKVKSSIPINKISKQAFLNDMSFISIDIRNDIRKTFKI